MREQYGRGALWPPAQRGAQIEAPAPGIVHTAEPEAVSQALDQDPAVAQYPHAGPLQLALDGVGPRPEIMVAKAGVDAVLCGDGCDRPRAGSRRTGCRATMPSTASATSPRGSAEDAPSSCAGRSPPASGDLALEPVREPTVPARPGLGTRASAPDPRRRRPAAAG